jgi:hypothetical protein
VSAIWTSSSRTRSKEPSLRHLCAGRVRRPSARASRTASRGTRARPKRSKELGAILTEILNEKLTITENGRRRQITKRKAFIKQLIDRTVLGDPKAMPSFLRLMNEIDREKKQGPRPNAGRSAP